MQAKVKIILSSPENGNAFPGGCRSIAGAIGWITRSKTFPSIEIVAHLHCVWYTGSDSELLLGSHASRAFSQDKHMRQDARILTCAKQVRSTVLGRYSETYLNYPSVAPAPGCQISDISFCGLGLSVGQSCSLYGKHLPFKKLKILQA